MIKENHYEYLIKLVIPGIKKEDLKLELIENELVVKIENYTTSYRFLKPIKEDEIWAQLENGILEIKVPKNVNKKVITIN